eukprot:GHVU01136766.1.p1 GENE.GHVU01136766.1~~GHVU01136766.1.p1  ORF type:complete len:144 (-),score=4.05 GHVU01136766.1:354-785(-)
MLRWVYHKYSDRGKYTAYMVAGAFVLHRYGLLDRDSHKVATQDITGERYTEDTHDTTIKSYLTKEYMNMAATIIVASKANYWASNHHVGQGSIVGYFRKVIDSVQNLRGWTSDEVYSTLYHLGHWASTQGVSVYNPSAKSPSV